MRNLNGPPAPKPLPRRPSVLAAAALFPLLAALAGSAVAQEPRAAAGQDRAIIKPKTERRVALVIGNSAYRNYPRLPNPVNDARAVAAALERTGFKVSLQEDVSRVGMIKAVRSFGDSLGKGGVALFYYAGHGVQVNERNFLVPVDADIQREDEVQHFSLDAAAVLDKMDRAQSRINLLILDACRNNPFGRATRGFGVGLAQMDAPYGTLIAYATAPGKLALDGDGPNGVYTTHLLKHIRTPDLAVEIMFKRVREGVTRETSNGQIPWESSSLRGDFYFVPGRPVRTGAAAAPKPSGEQSRFELAFWESIQWSTSKTDYEAYLKQYPQGRFASLARARIASAQGDRVPASAPPASSSAKGKNPDKAAPVQTAAAAPRANVLAAARQTLLPNVGDRWTYRHVDGFNSASAGTLTYEIRKISEAGISEGLQTSLKQGQVSQILIEPEPRVFYRQNFFNGQWPPDFAPYLQAFHELRQGAVLPSAEYWSNRYGYRFPLKLRVAGTETVTVPGGKFATTRVIAEGTGSATTAGNNPPRGPTTIQVRYEIWYAPKVKRFVKFSAQLFAGGRPWNSAVFELTDYSVK
jgi:uncharacterized caspase-like protein